MWRQAIHGESPISVPSFQFYCEPKTSLKKKKKVLKNRAYWFFSCHLVPWNIPKSFHFLHWLLKTTLKHSTCQDRKIFSGRMGEESLNVGLRSSTHRHYCLDHQIPYSLNRCHKKTTYFGNSEIDVKCNYYVYIKHNSTETWLIKLILLSVIPRETIFIRKSQRSSSLNNVLFRTQLIQHI